MGIFTQLMYVVIQGRRPKSFAFLTSNYRRMVHTTMVYYMLFETLFNKPQTKPIRSILLEPQLDNLAFEYKEAEFSHAQVHEKTTICGTSFGFEH